MKPKDWTAEQHSDGIYWRSPYGELYNPRTGWYQSAEGEEATIPIDDFVQMVSGEDGGQTAAPKRGATRLKTLPSGKVVDQEYDPAYFDEDEPDSGWIDLDTPFMPPKQAASGGLTAGQALSSRLAQQKFDYERQQDAIKADKEVVTAKIAEAIDARDFAALEYWRGVKNDLDQREFALKRQGQAFTQETTRREQIIELGRNPEDYLASAFARSTGQDAPRGNDLFDSMRGLASWKTADLNEQPLAGTSETTPLTTTPATTTPATATTAMYPAGYEVQNPNVAQQLQEWQAERLQNQQDPNDTAAFRQHLLGIGAPDFGVQAKPGEAIGPMAVKQATPLGATQTAGTQALATGAQPKQQVAPGGIQPLGMPTVSSRGGVTPLQPQGKFPTWEELRNTGIPPESVRRALTPLGSPGNPAGGLNPFRDKLRGGIGLVDNQVLGAMNPQDVRALGATYGYTGNKDAWQGRRQPGRRRAV